MLGWGEKAPFASGAFLNFWQSRNQMSRKPAELVEKINRLVETASPTGIPADRVRPFARILVAAELEDHWNKIGDEHSRRSTYEMVGELHGVDGYFNPDQAERAYRQGRKARQIVHNAARPVRLAIWRLIEIVKTNHAALPLHIQYEFPQALNVALEPLDSLIRLTHVAGDSLKQPIRRDSYRVSVNAQTYLWWRYLVANYRGKWADMYALARVWRLSDVRDEETFRRYVLKIARGVTEILACPPWATPKQ
jgi:hypothetical protein